MFTSPMESIKCIIKSSNNELRPLDPKRCYSNYYFYTFTLAPSTYHQYPVDQVNLAQHILRATLEPYETTTVAELTENYNIHFHSIIYIPNERSRFLLTKRIYSMTNQYKRIFGIVHKFQFSSVANLIEKVKYIKKGHADALEYGYPHWISDKFHIFNALMIQNLIYEYFDYE